MKKFLFVLAVLYGTYWYASNRFNFADTLVYAKKNPQASWAPAADYYVGLVYYQRAQYDKSEEAFTQLLTDYSTGPYVSRGLFRLAAAAEESRHYEVARQSLQRLIDEYPNDPNRTAAEQKLEIIKFK